MGERDPRWPHVTDILQAAGLVDMQWIEQYHLDRGTAIHLATQFIDDDDLDPSTVDPAIEPYLEAYYAFRAQGPVVEILAREEFVVRTDLDYCGTLDMRFMLADPKPREGILDIKAGAPSPWHPIQLAAYAQTFERPIHRFNLYLRQDGTFQFIEHRKRIDFAVWSAARILATWKSGIPKGAW